MSSLATGVLVAAVLVVVMLASITVIALSVRGYRRARAKRSDWDDYEVHFGGDR